MIHLIKEILEVKAYKVTVRFNTDEVRVIDLEEKLQEWGKRPGSKFSQLLDPDYFNSVYLEEGAETLAWNNGIDLDPEVLYEMSVEINKEHAA